MAFTPSGARRVPAVLLAGAAVVAIWTALQPPAELPPFNPSGDQSGYELLTPPELAVIEPMAHAAWLRQPPAFYGALLGVVLALAGMLASVASGATPAAAAAAITATMVAGPMAATVRHAGPAALALACVWAAWWAAAHREGPSSRWRLTAAVVLIALAGWWSWMPLLGVPVILTAVSAEPTRHSRAWLPVGVAAAVAAALVLYSAHLAALASAAAAPAQLSVGAADVWRALLYDGARPGRVAFVGPDWAPVWSPLVAALAMVGVAVIRGPARQRAGLIAAVLLAATIGLAYGQFRDELARFVAWMLAPVAGVGLSWIAGQAPAARRGAVVAALALVLIIAGAASSARPPGIADARLFASRFAESLKALRGTAGPAPLAVVAEDTLVDSAVVAFGGGLHRLPQDADAAAFAWSSGAHVVAGPSARRNLEALGLVFRGVHSIAEPMRFEWSAVIDRHQCAAVRVDRWSLLPGLEFTGRIGLMVPAGLGELRLIVGDSLPVALRAERPDGLPVSIAVETLLTGHAMNLPPPDYWFDGGSPQSAPGEVVRATIAANPMADRIVAVHLGRRSPRVLARLRGYPVGAHGRVCAAPLGPDRLFAAPVAEERIVLEAEPLFGTGWYGFERYGASAFRWGSGDAVVLVPLEKRGPLRVSTRLAPAVATGEPPELVLEVNGIEQARRATRPGLGDYSWDVPARVWVTGVNDLRFHVTRTVRPADQGGGDRRVLGFALHELKLSLVQRRQ